MVLKITTQTPRLDGKLGAQKTKKTTSSSGEAFSIETLAVSSPKTTAPISQTRSIQQDDAPKKRALKKGKSLLDALDKLRISLIVGDVPDLSAIKDESAFVDEAVDEKLQDILTEIETRAAVELAKLESVKNIH